MEIGNLARPTDLDAALELIRIEGGVAVGGGLWLRMGSKSVGLAVDLSGLGLDYIRPTGGAIAIGAMTTFRKLETSALLAELYGGFFKSIVGSVVGVQFRNMASVGGTVAGRYAFAGLNAAFLALGAKVAVRGEGEVDFEAFLSEPRTEPFLVEKVSIPSGAKAGYSSVALTKGDFSMLVAAAAFAGGAWRVAVGARPGAARLCEGAMRLLGAEPRPSAAAIGKAAAAAAGDVDFADDVRSSAEYRREVCPVLARRAIEEALK
jgi:CO/xanthine dehydrogenase FAD-binding subunit